MTPENKSSQSREPKNGGKKPSDWTPTSDRNTTTGSLGAKDKNIDSASDQERDGVEGNDPASIDPTGSEIAGEQAVVAEGGNPPHRALRSAVIAAGGDKPKRKSFRMPDDDPQV